MTISDGIPGVNGADLTERVLGGSRGENGVSNSDKLSNRQVRPDRQTKHGKVMPRQPS